MLRRHLHQFGTAPDGRLFRDTRGGMLSESVYGRAWHTARQAALGPGLAATALVRRPYDLRHAALSLWLNASGAPAEVAARAGSVRALHDVYLHCIDSHGPDLDGSHAVRLGVAAAHDANYCRRIGVGRDSPCPVQARPGRWAPVWGISALPSVMGRG